jgi:hypothetical protein
VHPVPTPSAIVAAINEQINRRDFRHAPYSSTIPSLLRSGRVKPLIAFVLTIAAVVYILIRSGSPLPGSMERGAAERDVIGRSINTYPAVLKGDIAPQVVSDIPDQVKSYFSGKTEFSVFVPTLRECRLVGGGLNDYRGTSLAHVFYKHGDQMIYLSQACLETVMRGEKLDLPPEARDELARSGWYRASTPDGASVVIWKKGSALCMAISLMDAEHLMAHLVEARDSSGW